MLPLQCMLCRAGADYGALCAGCLADVQRLRLAAPCPRCGLPQTQSFCGACLRNPPPLERLAVAYEYTAPLDSMVRAYKYRRHWQLAATLARLLPAPPPAQLILPLPLHPARERWRGFNQVRELAKKARLPVADGLMRRVVNTVPQVQITGLQARIENIQGAFEVDEVVRGQSVLLIDDVMTTGATLYEAARTLKAAGAKTVSALLLARTVLG